MKNTSIFVIALECSIHNKYSITFGMKADFKINDKQTKFIFPMLLQKLKKTTISHFHKINNKKETQCLYLIIFIIVSMFDV